MSEVVFADLGSVIRAQGRGGDAQRDHERVEREEPAIVVIDSFKALRDILGDAPAIRNFVYDLAVHMAGWGAASLLVGEYTEAEIATEAEFAIADGIIRFTNRRHELTAVREVEVLKLRGADYVTGGHFFEIGADGLAFFPRVRSPDARRRVEEVSTAERVATGVGGLDDDARRRAAARQRDRRPGRDGDGKDPRSACSSSSREARRGEAGIHFSLEETPDQLRGIAHGFGWDLLAAREARAPHVQLHLARRALDRPFLDRARQQVEQLGARRAVLDSLTSMALGVPSERRFKELVYAITKHFRARGVTLHMNMEIADLLGSAQLSGHGISFAADNVIQLKYVEVEGRLERGISVLKARGVRHATDVRRMTLEADGIAVGPRFPSIRGVLTGLPTGSEEEQP